MCVNCIVEHSDKMFEMFKKENVLPCVTVMLNQEGDVVTVTKLDKNKLINFLKEAIINLEKEKTYSIENNTIN